MTRDTMVNKIAYAFWERRMRRGISGTPQLDHYFASQAVNFFEKLPRHGEWWWEKDYEDFRDFEDLYNELVNAGEGHDT